MRRKDQEITDRKKINEILSKSEVCRIAMIDNDKPYIIPLNYGYYNNAIYIHSAPVGKKIDILKRNNKVCFELEYCSEIVKHESACDWSTKYRSVIGFGTVEIITDFEEKKKCLDIIMAHYGKSGKNVYKDKQVDFVVILKLNIEQITGKQLGEWD